MSVKLQPRPHVFARSLLLVTALAIACAPEDEDDNNGGFGQTPGAIQSDAAVLPDTGVPPVQTATPDAGSTFVPPVAVPDSGVVVATPDAGTAIPPVVDAGLTPDAAGPIVGEAGATGDAGAAGDSGGGCPTYEDFGRMFMSTYCGSCHMGSAAPRMVRLDTLAGVAAQKAAIKRVAVTSMAMPPSGMRPSAADRMKLGQWLDCGPM